MSISVSGAVVKNLEILRETHNCFYNLQSDQAFQMHNAAHQASIEAQILSQIVDSPYNEQDAPYLICPVRRDHLVEDTLTFVRCQSHMQHFKKPLKVINICQLPFPAFGYNFM